MGSGLHLTLKQQVLKPNVSSVDLTPKTKNEKEKLENV